MGKILRRAAQMCQPAAVIMKISYIISVVLILFSMIMMLNAGEFSDSTYRQYAIAYQLFTLPQGVLLVGEIAAVVIEELYHGNE